MKRRAGGRRRSKTPTTSTSSARRARTGSKDRTRTCGAASVAGIVAIGHVGVRTSDLAKLTAFYRDVVGLRLTVAYAGVVSIFEVGDVDLFLEPGRRGELAFDLAAEDVDAYRGRVVDEGVECAYQKSSRQNGIRSLPLAV